MNEQDAEDWLESWAEENLQTPGYYENKTRMRNDAIQCREKAKEEGIGEVALLQVAGGDLEMYLLKQQNGFTDSEVRRKADKDD